MEAAEEKAILLSNEEAEFDLCRWAALMKKTTVYCGQDTKTACLERSRNETKSTGSVQRPTINVSLGPKNLGS
jgi:hypothetical protein